METKSKDVEVVAQIKPKREITLDPSRMQLAEYLRNDWVVTAEQGTLPEDIVNTAYFAHMASQMKPYDHLEVRVDDGTWLANLIVLQVERNWVRVKLLSMVDLTTTEQVEGAPSIYSAQWKGPHLKWSVIRSSDQVNVKSGFADKVGAESAMRELERQAA